MPPTGFLEFVAFRGHEQARRLGCRTLASLGFVQTLTLRLAMGIQTEVGFQAYAIQYFLSALVSLIVRVEYVKTGREVPPLARESVQTGTLAWHSGFPSCSKCLAALWEASLPVCPGPSHKRSKQSLPVPVLMPSSLDLFLLSILLLSVISLLWNTRCQTT